MISVTVDELNEKLNESLLVFKEEIEAFEDNDIVVSRKEAGELVKQVWYTLSTFKDNIIEYLKEH